MSRYANALIIENGRVLLGRRTFGVDHRHGGSFLLGCYATPGGRIEDGHSIEDTAVREAKEETGAIRLDHTRCRTVTDPQYGLDVSPVVVLPSVARSYPSVPEIQYVQCRVKNGKLHPNRDSNELVDIGWFTHEQVARMLYPPGEMKKVYTYLDSIAKRRREIGRYHERDETYWTGSMPLLNVVTPVDSMYLRLFFL